MKPAHITKKSYTVEEKRALLLEYGKMVGKTVAFVSSDDVQYAYNRMEINLLVGKIIDCKWASFNPEYTIDLGNNKCEQVNAFALGVTMFEDISKLGEVLNEFFSGETFNFNTRLKREHKVSEFIWKTRSSFLSGYTLAVGRQLLCIDKKQGIVSIVKVGVTGDEFELTNKERISIMQERITDTERYSYYSVSYHNGILTIDEPENFYKEIDHFMEGRMSDLKDEDLRVNSLVSNLDNDYFDVEKNVEEALSGSMNDEMKEKLRKVISEVLEEKIPEIIEEILERI